MALTRREVISGALATAAVRPAFGAAYRPMLAAASYVWTQKFDREKKSLADGIGDAIAGTRKAGFRRMELMSSCFTPEVREKTLAALKEFGMGLPIVYQGGPMHETMGAEKTIAATVRLAELIKPAGARIIDFNPDAKPNHERKTDEELATQARYLSQMSRELSDRGVKLILHHHSPEMAENAREWRHILQHTDIPLCLDLHWVLRGGQDPMAILKEAGRRVASIHLRNSRQNIWTEEFGEGDINHNEVAAYLRRTGYAGYLEVELAYEQATKITRPLEEDLRISREYTERTFGVRA